jgi:predicted alpha/beta-fold hydrolase
MKLILATIAVCLLLGGQATAEPFDFPKTFQTEEITSNGTTIHVRIGGKGPAVLLIHGYGDTGDMWAPLATELMADHTVIAPDLRGMGLSAVATDGFTKQNEAKDLAGVLDTLKVSQADVVGHDIGKHGRVCLCQGISRPHHATSHDGRPRSRYRPLGRHS